MSKIQIGKYEFEGDWSDETGSTTLKISVWYCGHPVDDVPDYLLEKAISFFVNGGEINNNNGGGSSSGEQLTQPVYSGGEFAHLFQEALGNTRKI